MIPIDSYESLLETIAKNNLILVFSKTPNCSVCHVDLPRVAEIAADYELDAYLVDVSEHPLALGQLNLFSAPTVILFYEGREIHRQARFIDFLALRYRIEQVIEHSR